MFSIGKRKKANVNWFERKSAKLRKVREYFIYLKIQNEDFCQYGNQVLFSLDYRDILYSASENIFPKVISKYQVSMLTLPSHVSQNPFQDNQSKNNISLFLLVYEKVLRIFVNLLSQLVINKKVEKGISVSIYHCQERVLYELSLYCI